MSRRVRDTEATEALAGAGRVAAARGGRFRDWVCPRATGPVAAVLPRSAAGDVLVRPGGSVAGPAVSSGSAQATGIEPIAAPTPSATASAPTRPMKRPLLRSTPMMPL